MGEMVAVSPITRIEGHLGIKVEVESQRIVSARSSGEMFRGFEAILKGRSPLDAQQITQRICGVCPISHGIASVQAQEEAYNIRPSENGRLLRNLILGLNYLQSHILHFYQLSALDYVDVTAVAKYGGSDPHLIAVKSWANQQLSSQPISPLAPFLPRLEGRYIGDSEANIQLVKHYLDALKMRRLAHKAAAHFAGKMPHAATLVPGGVTERVTVTKLISIQSILSELKLFIASSYLPDAVALTLSFPEYFTLGKGPGNFLAYGVFHSDADRSKTLFPSGVLVGDTLSDLDTMKIAEDVGFSRYSSSSGLHPTKGLTVPDPRKEKAYSWLKAPRYDGNVMEVGPLARIVVAMHREPDGVVGRQVRDVLAMLGRGPEELVSSNGRHAARAIECKVVADLCSEWLEALKPDKPSANDFTIPPTGNGVGLTEAPRGALGHWLTIADRKIGSYQCVVPTTWNCSPRDDRGNPGAVEQALVGVPVPDANNPIEAARVVRSFDPCIACAVH